MSRIQNLNLRNCTCYTEAPKCTNLHWTHPVLWNSFQIFIRSPFKGMYEWPHKKHWCPQFFCKKMKNRGNHRIKISETLWRSLTWSILWTVGSTCRTGCQDWRFVRTHPECVRNSPSQPERLSCWWTVSWVLSEAIWKSEQIILWMF